MSNTDNLNIRLATESDVDAAKELFIAAYGQDYPYKQFYDTSWLKKAVFDDDTLFLVAQDGPDIIGTASAVFAVGNLADLIAEFGRLVVHPQARGRNLGTRLFESAIDMVSDMIRFGFAEGRTAHSGSQKILERCGFVPLGFEPAKYMLVNRESMVMYGRLFGNMADLRRNHPRVIPEIAPLATTALQRIGLTPDVIVVDEEHGYPIATDTGKMRSGSDFDIEDLSEQGWSPLLRIERGRVRGRDVFGNLSLSHGFFKIKTDSTRYLMARHDGAVVGGLGFDHDPIDRKVRIFELVGINDLVKGQLLSEAQQIAQNELDVVYIEADVSAYTPAIQRTLERMGFMAVAYCPSMVFEDVERLDVVRMAKLTAPYFTEDIPLTDSAAEIRQVVERSMHDRREGNVVAQAARATDLFRGMDDGDVYHLARLGRLKTISQGQRLIRHGDPGDRLFIMVSGSAQVVINGKEVGTIGPGETVGEMALLETTERSADVIITDDADVVEIIRRDLAVLMDNRPRLATVVMHNLAANLAEKLRKVDLRYTTPDTPSC